VVTKRRTRVTTTVPATNQRSILVAGAITGVR
jgi:hypothetical protein